MPKKNHLSPKKRLLDTAVRLFYEQGYPTTGINQILKESNTYKKSFYQYFVSKEDLGLNYLETQGNIFLTFLEKLTRFYPHFEKFWNTWIYLLGKDIKKKSYRGCPFANFTNQTHINKIIFSKKIEFFSKRWLDVLDKYLRGAVYTGKTFNKKRCRELAELIMMLYEGAIQLYIITRDEKYIQLMKKQTLNLAKQYLNDSSE
jgi:AcrR family transcriptional regulator